MMLGRKGDQINEKEGRRAAAQGKTQPSPIWTNNKCGTIRKAKISRCLLAHHWQKRTRTPFTGRRLSSSESLSGVSSSSSTHPLRLRPILSFSNVRCFWTSCFLIETKQWYHRKNAATEEKGHFPVRILRVQVVLKRALLKTLASP